MPSTLGLTNLAVGVTAGDNYYDQRGIVLIAEGVEITPTLIDSIRRRGIEMLYLQPPQSHPPRPSSKSPRRRERPAPPKASAIPGISANYSQKKVQRVRDQFAAGEKAVNYLCQAIRRNGSADLRRTEACVEDYIDELVDDPDPVIANALLYQADLELAHRCVQLSVLSIAIAQQMDYSAEQLRDVGSAAIAHDWGLFDLAPESRFPHQAMSDPMRAEYRRHPITTVEMLRAVEGVSPEVMLFVSQVHECLDGSGFPRGLTADQLHLSSRIIGIADAYLTMTSPPKGYPRIVPCDAIAFLINGASQGTYSANAVTGLLYAVTMYPIGSTVELSDTTRARVIRANGKDYSYPIVESLDDACRIVNLKETDLFVTRPILDPQQREMRLPDAQRDLSNAIRGT